MHSLTCVAFAAHHTPKVGLNVDYQNSGTDYFVTKYIVKMKRRFIRNSKMRITHDNNTVLNTPALFCG
jgi:hypothetical protein